MVALDKKYNMKITLTGRVPSKKNSRKLFVRNGKIFNLPSNDYRDWLEDASWQLKAFKKTVFYPQNRIICTFYAGDKRKFDLSNKFESIADALVDNAMIPDDNYTVLTEVILLYGGYERGRPRTEIEIQEYIKQ